MTGVSATAEWRAMLETLLRAGADVAPMSAGADFKGRTSREIVGYQSQWDMANPIIACPARKLGYRFMAAEAAWTLSGSNRLEEIKPFGKNIARFTDDGIHMQGAYGPPFLDQVSYVVRALAADRNSRQAVATIWRPRPGPSNDTPCTVALQWMIRPGVRELREGETDLDATLVDKLHCVVTMRSSDAWTGVPYDIFNFSMMSAYVALSLREMLKDTGKRLATSMPLDGGPAPAARPLFLDTLYLTSGSQHLYKQDHDEARVCIGRGDERRLVALDLDDFAGPSDLVAYLWYAAKEGVAVEGSWLSDVCPKKVPA